MRTKVRKRKTEKNLLYFAVVLTVIVLFLLFRTADTANAGTQDSIRYKYYTSIQIEEGSSLWDIAQLYITEEYDSAQEYIDEVKKLIIWMMISFMGVLISVFPTIHQNISEKPGKVPGNKNSGT